MPRHTLSFTLSPTDQAELKSWVAAHCAHPRVQDWLNLVERWFGELTGERIRYASFVSVHGLLAAIDEF